jgi:hypothetical protein
MKQEQLMTSDGHTLHRPRTSVFNILKLKLQILFLSCLFNDVANTSGYLHSVESVYDNKLETVLKEMVLA